MAREIAGDPVGPETGGGTGGGFDPVPKGKYLCDIFDVTERQYGPNSANAGRESYNIQLRISGGDYDNRRVFTQVGLFPRWASGKDNFQFFQFFAAVKGVSANELRKQFDAEGGISVPDPEDLMGHAIEVTVGVEQNTWNGETTTRNNVRGFAPAGKGSSLPEKMDTVEELDL